MIHELDLRPVLPPWIFDLLALIIGLAVGSFANVCIYRIPEGQSVVRPPSRCPACGTLIRAFDNVPVLSWLWLGRRCRSCQEPISPRYPLVEAANGLLYLGLAVVGGPSIWTLVAMPFATALLVLALIDLEHHRLPNVITRPGIAAGLMASLLPGWPTKPGLVAVLLSRLVPDSTLKPEIVAFLAALIAAAGGYLAFAAVAGAYKWWRREDGLGQGDWKMAAMIGAFLGVVKLMLVVFIASLVGAIVGLFFIAFRGRDRRFALPLGTFLGAAGIVVILVGDSVLGWYCARFSLGDCELFR
jgi:leader peptidase (prepilin peptidase) / N-methyltransferase